MVQPEIGNLMSAAAHAPRTASDIAWNGHAGPALGHANGMDIIACVACGFSHAVPLPDEAALAAEYGESYYNDAKPTYLADARADQDWAQLVQHDRLDAIARALGQKPGVLVEIGSGPGFFLEAAAAKGWNAIGVEPSRRAAAFAQARGLTVHNRTMADAVAHGLPKANAIAATNVLEHLADPIGTLALARDLLLPGGVVCLTVPNDFSPLQRAARDAKGHAPWWVAPPHHLNYFDFDSLEALLVRLGFTPVERLTSFPMEAFLLMGDDYIADPALGRACHVKRKSFDLAFEAAGIGEVRRRLYGALANAGIGREATIVAVKA
jgi:SAM-dependent methyltransferase